MKPYYEDDRVTLWHGDCLEIAEWLAADVLVTDPPYGRAWRGVSNFRNARGGGTGARGNARHIASDGSTAARDAALVAWGDRLAMVFADPLCDRPAGAVQTLVYGKAVDAGVMGARGGFRRDVELVYLCGPWPVGVGGRSSILHSAALVAGPTGAACRYGHPHAKPLDLLEDLLSSSPPGAIADPFAGSGSTLVAAKALGRRAIGVELDERYCEIAARRLSQEVLDLGGIA